MPSYWVEGSKLTMTLAFEDVLQTDRPADICDLYQPIDLHHLKTLMMQAFDREHHPGFAWARTDWHARLEDGHKMGTVEDQVRITGYQR